MPRADDRFNAIGPDVPFKPASYGRPVDRSGAARIRGAPVSPGGTGPPPTVVPGPRIGTEEDRQRAQEEEEKENDDAFHDLSIAEFDY